jgi:hypothetical protein
MFDSPISLTVEVPLELGLWNVPQRLPVNRSNRSNIQFRMCRDREGLATAFGVARLSFM